MSIATTYQLCLWLNKASYSRSSSSDQKCCSKFITFFSQDLCQLFSGVGKHYIGRLMGRLGSRPCLVGRIGSGPRLVGQLHSLSRGSDRVRSTGLCQFSKNMPASWVRQGQDPALWSDRARTPPRGSVRVKTPPRGSDRVRSTGLCQFSKTCPPRGSDRVSQEYGFVPVFKNMPASWAGQGQDSASWTTGPMQCRPTWSIDPVGRPIGPMQCLPTPIVF